MHEEETRRREHTCACGCGETRRDFLIGAGAAAAFAMGMPFDAAASGRGGIAIPHRRKGRARIRAEFLYPPSRTFADDPDGWWSWPGNEFDAEGRQRKFTAAFRGMADRVAADVRCGTGSIASDPDAERLLAEVADERPDALLLVMFYNGSIKHAVTILDGAERLGLPVLFYIGLGVMHGPITKLEQRPGVCFMQSLDNLEAIEQAVRLAAAKKQLAQSRLLSITEAEGVTESVEPFLGVSTRVVPFAQYQQRFEAAALDGDAQAWLGALKRHARDVRGVTATAFENAARAHLALTRLLAEHEADGVTMNCLRRGMLKPCISFSRLNSALVPAACENDLPAAYGQMLGQAILGRPGFQHNPAYETERDHYYASHCTCPTRLAGPDGPESPYLLRRFAHTNEGSCAVQVFWRPDDAVTMLHYYPGEKPRLDVYAGRVVESHEMPPVGGCTTNVEIAVTDRAEATDVTGHHNVLFQGDHAKWFRRFARLYRIETPEPKQA